jgi:hypothetical protein
MKLSDVKIGDRVSVDMRTAEEIRLGVPDNRSTGTVELVVPHADVPYDPNRGYWPHKTRDEVLIKLDSGFKPWRRVEDVEPVK